MLKFVENMDDLCGNRGKSGKLDYFFCGIPQHGSGKIRIKHMHILEAKLYVVYIFSV